MILGLSALALGGCFAPQPLSGSERWRKFQELRSANAPSWKPDFTISRRRVRSGEPVELKMAAPRVSYFYVFLLLPNDDLYLLVPSPKIKDHRGRSLAVPPEDGDFEFVAPPLAGTFYVGVIAADQSINLLREGWIPTIGAREFTTWPRSLALDDALDFMVTALEDRPWATAEQSFEVVMDEAADPEALRKG